MTRRRFTKADYERMAEMREAGKTQGQIARAFKCSRSEVSWYCLKLGAEPPNPRPLRLDYHLTHPVVKRGKHQVRAFTPEDDERLLALECMGVRVSAIAKELGRTPNSVQGRMMTLARRAARVEGG
jgi:transposase-like protein